MQKGLKSFSLQQATVDGPEQVPAEKVLFDLSKSIICVDEVSDKSSPDKAEGTAESSPTSETTYDSSKSVDMVFPIHMMYSKSLLNCFKFTALMLLSFSGWCFSRLLQAARLCSLGMRTFKCGSQT